MTTSTALAAAAVAKVICQALTHDEGTPAEERLSFRVLCEVALPLLEQIATQEEPK